ncbi:MAG: sugar phosphate isomerase/epimerase [Treponema sp.]|nr:sugar phosphate isomerase/epimerase [Treponema sp.]
MIYPGYRTPSVTGLTFKEKIDLAVRLKLKSVELGPEDIPDIADAGKMAETAKAAGIMMRSMGLGAAQMCKPALREASLALLEDLIKKAKLLGIDILFSRTTNPEPGIRQADTWNYCAELYRLFCGICEDNGIKFALEVDHGNFVQNLERAEYLFEKVNHKNFFLNYDPANFYLEGSDPLKVIDHMKDYIVCGHIKDGVYRTDKIGETRVGEGELDYRAIFKKLNDENISIAMHLEHCKSAQEVIDGAEYIQKVLDNPDLNRNF